MSRETVTSESKYRITTTINLDMTINDGLIYICCNKKTGKKKEMMCY